MIITTIMAIPTFMRSEDVNDAGADVGATVACDSIMLKVVSVFDGQ
jgi:hypothetical protein